jgi:hypothetical protein
MYISVSRQETTFQGAKAFFVETATFEGRAIVRWGKQLKQLKLWTNCPIVAIIA